MNAYCDVRIKGLPNYLGARIPVPSNLNIKAWREALQGYHDSIICEYLEYGWPVGYSACALPESTKTNHKSAVDNPAAVSAFIDKECGERAMLGPFTSPPFEP